MSRAWLPSLNPYAIGVDIFVVDETSRARRWRCG